MAPKHLRELVVTSTCSPDSAAADEARIQAIMLLIDWVLEDRASEHEAKKSKLEQIAEAKAEYGTDFPASAELNLNILATLAEQDLSDVERRWTELFAETVARAEQDRRDRWKRSRL